MELNLGNSNGARMTLPLSCIMQSVGVTGAGRHEFMIELARQAIEADAGVIFLDGSSEVSTFAKLYASAEAVGRQGECFADGMSVKQHVTDIPLAQVVQHGSILWYAISDIERKPSVALPDVRRVLTELADALSRRQQSAKRRLVIIIDRIGGMCAEVDEVAALIGTALTSGNTTLIFSDEDAVRLNPAVLANADCWMFQRSLDSTTQGHFDSRAGGMHFDLASLDVGEAMVMLGRSAPARRLALAHEPIKLASEMRPANSAVAMS